MPGALALTLAWPRNSEPPAEPPPATDASKAGVLSDPSTKATPTAGAHPAAATAEPPTAAGGATDTSPDGDAQHLETPLPSPDPEPPQPSSNGALIGLVGITSATDVIGPLLSLVVGALSGLVVVEAVLLMDRLRLDDPVGAVPVHLVGGGSETGPSDGQCFT